MRPSNQKMPVIDSRIRAAYIADALERELSIGLALLSDVPAIAAGEMLLAQGVGTRSLYRGLGLIDPRSDDPVTELGWAVVEECARRHDLPAGASRATRPLRSQLLRARIRPAESD